MKSKRMKYGNNSPNKECEYMTLPGSHYARYLLQAGCFFWQGRTFHRNSYIVQRKDKVERQSRHIHPDTGTTRNNFNECVSRSDAVLNDHIKVNSQELKS